MRIITRIKPRNPSRAFTDKLCLAIGNFDGVHRGHQAILKKLVDTAARVRGIPAVYTFVRHPQNVLHPNRPTGLLSPLDDRLALLKSYGVKVCYVIRFTRLFSKLEPEEFVRDILVKALGVHQVFMGYNARFGHKRKGTVRTMKQLADRFGFLFNPVGPLRLGDTVPNSSAIRRHIAGGTLKEASALLGYPPRLFARVVKGNKRGRRIGFPTANLGIHPEGLTPPTGVYAVRVDVVTFKKDSISVYETEFEEHAERRALQGVMNFGFRPTFNKRGSGKPIRIRPLAEVHLLRFRGNVYGKSLRIHLIKRLRSEMQFEGTEALRKQIQKDISHARKYLKLK